ncbi:histidine kinase [Mucilaginibacter sp. JRF]|uniref:sensor histidine kinase n=1 Tax=Mucilaginibacter sp. JRF TaxID=2780088 RepID=UPI00188208CB|nr:histidine kinase [Mucilaginibacter sp. JRF]MBE9586856.1 histidine kinase [Mucilaginibacter sp. JRF]
MIGILAFGTLLMRPGFFTILNLGQYAVHLLSITVSIITCWLVQGRFRNAQLPGYSAYAKAVLGIVCAMIVSGAFSYALAFFIPERYFFPENHLGYGYVDFIRRLVGSFFLSMATYIVLNNLDTSEKLQQTKLENEQFKQAHLRAQLLSLQQQISPHFLFNSLSTLKTIATDDDTKNFVIQLSHVYRYLLNFNERQVSRLSEELAFIRSYLYILHQRFDTALQVSINVPERLMNCVIPPLSLQLLVENAIKHNAISPDQPLLLNVSINQNDEIVVENNYQPKKIPAESTGLGLQNINDRFRLMFNREIRIDHTSEKFTVTLPLISHEHYHH